MHGIENNKLLKFIILKDPQVSSIAQSCQLFVTHGLLYIRLPCPLPTPRAWSNSYPKSQWCHPTMSSFCRPLFLLTSIFHSIRVFSNKSVLHIRWPSIRVFSNKSVLYIRWPRYWSFSFSTSPSNEYSGLIFFRNVWFDLFVVQGTLKSLLQHHGSKPSILQHSAFFTVQLSHPYMTTGITIAFSR